MKTKTVVSKSEIRRAIAAVFFHFQPDPMKAAREVAALVSAYDKKQKIRAR